jgi:hypothetical protein
MGSMLVTKEKVVSVFEARFAPSLTIKDELGIFLITEIRLERDQLLFYKDQKEKSKILPITNFKNIG